MGVHVPQELPFFLLVLGEHGLVGDADVSLLLWAERLLGVDIGAVASPLRPQPVDVNLAYDQLGLDAEPLRLLDEPSVLENQRIATIHNILCALAISASAIDVATDVACALLLQEVNEVAVLANQLVGCREVEDDVRPTKCQLCAWRIGRPHILAYLHGEPSVLIGVENLPSCRQQHILARIAERRVVQVLRRGEPPFLIKLAVIG